MLDSIISILVTGAMLSAVYALIAVGFTMIFGVGGVLNLAHGGLIMIGAYTYLVVTDASFVGLHPVVGFVVAIAIAAIASYVLYIGLVQFIEDDIVITFLATVVVALLLTQLATMQFTTNSYTLAVWGGSFHLESVGVRVRYNDLLGFVASWIAIGLLWYYVTKTDQGRSILAASMSERGAQLTGVDLRAVKARTWLIAGGLAGLAGIFLGTRTYPADPEMWLNPLALAFIIVVIGGIGSIKGSIVAAYLIGYLETIAITQLGASYQGIFALIVLVAVLIVLPEGLYGREFVHD
ncbi:branched-chain amino acid ABC transporter permease [Natronorubrum daqingense]|uniref:Amino acid/amide ABC transporter membrane protein 1, HAAT family n=1 Tax=Natronorubrum daqingense TaxID=588898 RepID=A0A1N6YU09_9EURY|nr:branched-chain amino acid ABC transporter permease [Natronorubrum daqingense]APX95568.1 branched-chain amino acid ABC transporter permease [Natronorubrum daqingense]SIR17891.1 amino acid/amide ABC transporter membrane protein 1, HAAT family [Natronorubrum daqingense]